MKRGIAVGVLILAILAVGVWRCRSTTTSSNKSTTAGSQTASGVRPSTGSGTTTTGRAIPVWFAPRGVAAKRIAGHVTEGGKPVAGATVPPARATGFSECRQRVVCEDLAAYQRLYDEELTTPPGVQRLTSTLVMKDVVARGLPL